MMCISFRTKTNYLMSAANDRILAVNLQSWHRKIKEMYVQARRHKHGTNWSSTTVIANRGIVLKEYIAFVVTLYKISSS